MMVQVRKRPLPTPKAAARATRPIDGLLDAGVFKALSDPTRLLIFACLSKCGRACGVGEVAQCCAVDLSVVSRHLATLADAGLIEASKEGRTVSYRVRYAKAAALFRDLAKAMDDCCPTSCDAGACGCCPPAGKGAADARRAQ